MTLTILFFLLPLELGGVKLPWTHPLIISLLSASVPSLLLFLSWERRVAEPIIPLGIFHQHGAVSSYLIMMLQVAAQLGVSHDRLLPLLSDSRLTWR